MWQAPAQHAHSQARKKAMFGGLIVVALTMIALIAVTQLRVIREFFSRASGEPANLVIDTL